MILTQTIPWADFSGKHKRYINAALDSKICVAMDATRYFVKTMRLVQKDNKKRRESIFGAALR